MTFFFICTIDNREAKTLSRYRKTKCRQYNSQHNLSSNRPMQKKSAPMAKTSQTQPTKQPHSRYVFKCLLCWFGAFSFLLLWSALIYTEQHHTSHESSSISFFFNFIWWLVSMSKASDVCYDTCVSVLKFATINQSTIRCGRQVLQRIKQICHLSSIEKRANTLCSMWVCMSKQQISCQSEMMQCIATNAQLIDTDKILKRTDCRNIHA